MSNNAHILDDDPFALLTADWLIRFNRGEDAAINRGDGTGMSKAQKIAIAPAVVSAIVRSASKRAKRIDAHAPIELPAGALPWRYDTLATHVIGETTLGERIKDFAKDAGLTLSPGASKTLICPGCNSEVVRSNGNQQMCPPCAKAKAKAKTKVYRSKPEAKAKKKARESTPEAKAKAKAQMKAYQSTPEAKAKAKARKARRAAVKKALVSTKE